MRDMDESDIEERILILEAEEIPRIRRQYDAALHEFLDCGCFPSPALHTQVDAAKVAYLEKCAELEDLKNMLFYLKCTE